MGKALDLAGVPCATAAVPGTIHDPHFPLQLGTPENGEYTQLDYNDVNKTAVLDLLSASLSKHSTLVLDLDGNLLINGAAIPSTTTLNAAVTAAQNAAVTSQTAATNAGAAATSAASSADAAQTIVTDFQDTANAEQAQSQLLLDAANVALGTAQNDLAAVTAAVGQAQTAAGQSATSASNSRDFASAAIGLQLPDGSFSALHWADQSRQTAQISRIANTQVLNAADFTFIPNTSHLFKRLRCNATAAASQVTIPPNLWTNTAGEAWMSFRLENTGTVKFVPQGGTSGTFPPPVDSSHSQDRIRFGSGQGSIVMPSPAGVLTIVTGKTGKFVLLGGAQFVGTGANLSISVALAKVSDNSAVPAVIRLNLPALEDAQHVPWPFVVEADIVNWSGGDIRYQITVGAVTPNAATTIFLQALFVEAASSMITPVNTSRVAANAGSAAITSAAVAQNSLVIFLGFQRGIRANAIFSSFSGNLTDIRHGDTNGVAPAAATQDTDEDKNFAWGLATGVQGATGAFTGQINFTNATRRTSALQIIYPPNTGATAPDVTFLLQGGRNTLTEIGAEAELWFNPDGRTVVVQIPSGSGGAT